MAANPTSGAVLEKQALAAAEERRESERKSAEASKRTAQGEPESPLWRILDPLTSFFSSLRLTVVLLALGIVLVFAGTIAQVDLGTFRAQNEFFRSLAVYWTPKGSTMRIPVLPGGYTIGTFLLINLVTAHFQRFQWTRKKAGIWMVQPPS